MKVAITILISTAIYIALLYTTVSLLVIGYNLYGWDSAEALIKMLLALCAVPAGIAGWSTYKDDIWL